MADPRPATSHGAPLARVPALGLVGVAICSVQVGSAVAAQLFSRVGPGGAALLRLVTATVILLVLWPPRLGGRGRRELALAALFGVALGGMNLCFYEALSRIPLGIAVTIEFIGPLGVAIGGSHRALDLLWVALALGGILLLTRGGTGGLSGLGIVFALLAGAFWGSYILLNARVGRAYDGGSGLALAMAVGVLVAVPAGIADGGSRLLEPRSLAIGAAVGMLSSAIPYSFEIEALRRIDAGVFAVLMSLEPAVAALVGLIVLGQRLGVRALAGIVLVVLASAGASLRARRAPIAV